MSVDRGRRRRHLSSVHVPPCADRFTRYARSTGRYRGLLKGHPPGVSSSVSFSTTDFLATWIFGVFAYFFVVFVVFRSFSCGCVIGWVLGVWWVVGVLYCKMVP